MSDPISGSHGNIGVYNTVGGGAAVNTGLSGSLSVTGGASSVKTICGFAEPFVEYGGQAGLGPEGGISGYTGFDTDRTIVVGGSVSTGVGSGGQVYIGGTVTKVTPIYGRKSSCS